MSHTYAELPVSRATYEEIRRLLVDAGYHHALAHGDGAIDMHGIGLVVRSGPVMAPREATFTARKLTCSDGGQDRVIVVVPYEQLADPHLTAAAMRLALDLGGLSDSSAWAPTTDCPCGGGPGHASGWCGDYRCPKCGRGDANLAEATAPVFPTA